MKILISNDDGYDAPGIIALSKHMQELGETVIVAPDRNKSGSSNSLTLSVPFHVKKINSNTYSVQGTPTDCVHVALTAILKDSPDIVLSGINSGANLADDILYSGTVAAAIEGRCMGKPAIAISLIEPCKHYDTAAIIAKDLVKKILKDPLPLGTILNVNVPDKKIEDIKGIESVRLGTRHRVQNAIPDHDPRGKQIYWIGPPGPELDNSPGTDFNAIKNNKVALTPISTDLTDFNSLNQIKIWTNSFDK